MIHVKDEKNIMSIETRHLLALCEIENFNQFRKELEELIASKRPKNLINKVYRVMRGESVLGNKKIKDFVKKYQNEVDVLNKYRITSNLTVCFYDYYGRKILDFDEDYFLEFINSHKDEVETIKNVVQKIYQLGFDKIYYDEKIDFTNIEYKLNTSLYFDHFEYLENMERVPSYGNNSIKYKTTDSCYCMTISTAHSYGGKIELRNYNWEIYLNSLIFDPNRLPDEINLVSTYEVIKKMANEKVQEGKIIKELVDVSVAIDDLVSQYEKIEKVIESVGRVKNKEKLKQALISILDEINKLKVVELNLRQESISEYQGINEEKVELEKQLYLHRRYLDSVHDSW